MPILVMQIFLTQIFQIQILAELDLTEQTSLELISPVRQVHQTLQVDANL